MRLPFPKRTFLGAVFFASVWLFMGGPFGAPAARAAAPVFEAGSTAVGDSDLVTIAKPSGTAAGDLLVAVVNFEKGSNVTVFTPPAGWTLIRRDNQAANIGMATFYKIAGASEGASYTWTLNGAPKWAAGIARISGVNGGSPINTSNGSVLNTGNPTAPSVNTTVNDTLVLAFYTNKKNATYIPAAGTTERWDAPNAAGQPSNMMATFGVAGAGASGSKTATVSDATGDWAAQQVALAGADTVAPSAVNDLTLSSPTTSSMVLTWTAPGDDGAVGTAALYDIRYSTSPIATDGDFAAAWPVAGEPTPAAAGTSQNMTVTDLSAGTLYYFAMKTQDEMPNTSAISNTPSLSTVAAADVVAPSAVNDLALSSPTTSSMVLTWTAPGDDGAVGTAALYDIRSSTSPIATAGDFSAATPVSGEPAPAAAGTSQNMTVTGLSAGTLYYFAMKTRDEAPNLSAVSNVPSRATAALPGSKTGNINVVKRVINDNGGTLTLDDFPLFVSGTPVISGVTNSFPAPAGAYTVYVVTEVTQPAYVQTFSGDCDTAGRVSILPGDNKFCIVTNDDVGAAVAVPPVPPLIDVVKVPSPLALPGGPGPVTYTYTLRNLGTVPVTDITMAGDSCSPIVRLSGDSDGDDQLGVSETWTYRCSTTLLETHTNTVLVTGWANGLTATDIASATVVVGVPVVPPLIYLSLLPSPLTIPAIGGEVIYTARVANPGKVALSDIRLANDACATMEFVSGDTDGDSMLDTSETWTYACRTYQSKTTTATATVSGEANGLAARDLSIATVVVATPGDGKINVVQRVINDNGGTMTLADFRLFINGQQVGSGVTNSLPAPGTYFVTGTGDSGYAKTFSGDCGTNSRMTIDPGDSKLCVVTFDDIAKALALPPAPSIPPLIAVLRVPSPLTLPDGPGQVTYTYTLNNLGSGPVTDITMVGDACDPIIRVSGDVDLDEQLDTEETWSYSCTETVTETETGTVTATGWSNGLTASDTASATVVVGSSIVPPLIHVTNVPNRLTIPEGGGKVGYTSTVTNPGSAPLSDVVHTDDACAPTLYFFGDRDGDRLLDSDEAWTYTCWTEISKTTTNTVRVDGAANGLVARDYATATVVVAQGATIFLRLVGWSVAATIVIGIALLLYGIRRRRMARLSIEESP